MKYITQKCRYLLLSANLSFSFINFKRITPLFLLDSICRWSPGNGTALPAVFVRAYVEVFSIGTVV